MWVKMAPEERYFDYSAMHLTPGIIAATPSPTAWDGHHIQGRPVPCRGVEMVDVWKWPNA